MSEDRGKWYINAIVAGLPHRVARNVIKLPLCWDSQDETFAVYAVRSGEDSKIEARTIGEPVGVSGDFHFTAGRSVKCPHCNGPVVLPAGLELYVRD